MAEALLAGIMALVAAAVGAPSCRTADSRVEQAVAAEAARLAGREYCQFRLYDTIDDVDGDGVDDFLVVFSVEGVRGRGNDSIQLLAVFASAADWRPVLEQVGARGERVITKVAVKNAIITLSALAYQGHDAMCCPTRPIEARYRLERGSLVREGIGG